MQIKDGKELERVTWTKHGMYNTRIYNIYKSMKQRCFNKNCPSYKRYGARGITICDEWIGKNGFMNFYNWSMLHGYSDNLTIDRIDNDANYEPDNCRWADRFIQNNNFSRNKNYTFNGETHSLSVWGRIKPNGLCYETLRSRLRDGWSVEDTFTIPYTPNNEEDIRGKQITINGEIHNVTWWCRKTGIDKCTYYRRLKYGWSKERALTEPSHERHIKKEYRNKQC